MKILLAIQMFTDIPINKSTTEIIFNISKTLLMCGHEVTIYTTNYKLDQKKVKDLIRIGAKFSISRVWGNIGGFILSQEIISSALNLKKFDVIHLHNYRTFQNIILAFFATLFNIPYVLQAEGSLTTFYQKKKLKIIFDFLFGKKMISNAKKVIASSKQELKEYLQLGVSQDKIVIVPFTINTIDYSHLPVKGIFRKKYMIDENKKIILYLGRLHKMKGLDLLLLAFSDLQKKEYNPLLVIIGPDDGYLSELCHLIQILNLKEKCIVCGPLYNSDKLEAYVDANVYVLPSYHDDFGLSALEALACGTPVIITNCCGAADIVSKNAGLVIDCDKSSLANSIMTILSDDNLQTQLSKNGKLLITSNYTWNVIIKLLERCYESCSSKKI